MLSLHLKFGLRFSLGFVAIFAGISALGKETYGDSLQSTLLAKAPIDECYCGIGDTDNITVFEPGFADALTPAMDCSGVNGGHGDNLVNDLDVDERAQCIPKRNETFPWGLTVAGEGPVRKVWLGGAANVPCWLAQTILTGTITSPGIDFIGETGFDGIPFHACEQQFSTFPSHPSVPEGSEDMRPATVYVQLLGQNPPATAGPLVKVNIGAECGPDAADLMSRTTGLRSAGSLSAEDIIILGGPDVSGDGINMIAFRNSDGACLDAQHFDQWNSIRKWLSVHDSQLYTTVGNSDGGGSVLRWLGTELDPLQFSTVGRLGSAGANLTLHNDRIVVTTWPNTDSVVLAPPKTLVDLFRLLILLNSKVGIASVYVGPPVSKSRGLRWWNRGQWNKIFSINEYDRNFVTSRASVMGAAASNGDEICFGTMQAPFVALFAHALLFDPEIPDCFSDEDFCAMNEPDVYARFLEALSGNTRPATVFCASGVESPETAEIRLLYGETELPQFNIFTRVWGTTDTGFAPLFGAAGFGGNSDLLNTWTATNCGDDKIYIGAADISEDPSGDEPFEGAELWELPDGSETVASRIDDQGLGNRLNIGYRTAACLETTSGDKLLTGMASASNLAESIAPPAGIGTGGWELRLVDIAPSSP